MTKTNKLSVHPAKTQISLGSEDSDQTGRMPRLSESSLGAHSFCWFLSCGGSYNNTRFGLRLEVCNICCGGRTILMPSTLGSTSI